MSSHTVQRFINKMVKKKKKDSSSSDLLIETEGDWNNLKNTPGIYEHDINSQE